MSKTSECSWCGALISAGMMENHRTWHRKLEPELEEPTSPFGFWDLNGRWNANSREW
jgi:hypothetical protein